ncbi:TPA: hypothetical protein SLU54_002358 [Pseudomonas aeruginosa]|nr:hypothetical protein [Pseudomonas aeruginosa]
MDYYLDYIFSEFSQTAMDGAEKHFTGNPDDLTVILKGHLIVEKLMRDFCMSLLPNPDHFARAKLSFSQLVSITRALAVCPNPDVDDSWIWGAVNRLNYVRNIYAHQLEPDAEKLEEELEKLRLSLRAVEADKEPDWAHRISGFVGAFSTYIYLSEKVTRQSKYDRGIDEA